MPAEQYSSQGKLFKIFTYPSPSDGKRYPAVVLVHGNAGLTQPFGDQIQSFAHSLSKLGYFVAVPSYYSDNAPHLLDQSPHEQTISDAIADIASRPETIPAQLGLIGFSLGATTAMTYIATNNPGTVRVLVDFFGFLTPKIRAEVGRFPPTIIFHDKYDKIVSVQNSIELDSIIPSTIEHKLVQPYEERWDATFNHAFQPGGTADMDSRQKATDWIVKHLPPVGV